MIQYKKTDIVTPSFYTYLSEMGSHTFVSVSAAFQLFNIHVNKKQNCSDETELFSSWETENVCRREKRRWSSYREARSFVDIYCRFEILRFTIRAINLQNLWK